MTDWWAPEAAALDWFSNSSRICRDSTMATVEQPPQPAGLPLRLPALLREEIAEGCMKAYPQEACGILLGTETDAGRWVTRVLPVANEAPDGVRRRRYSVPGASLLHAERQASAAGEQVLGFYHSHPDHSPQPSPTDLAHAWPYYSYVIVSVHGGGIGELRSWRLDESAGRFHAEPLSIVHPEKSSK